jgi:very-short-patch-repair endonuclease
MPSRPPRAALASRPDRPSSPGSTQRGGLSLLEEQFALQLRALKLPEPVREFVFAKPRRWRADFAWPELKVLVEVEGGTWVNGRHNRGAGFEADLIKYNAAALLGYAVLRFSGAAVKSGDAARTTALALNRRAA